MAEEDQIINKAETTEETVKAEAQPEQPVGPTLEQLQAQLSALEAKYIKEIGDKDRGNARLAGQIHSLQERLANAEKSADTLARRTFGEEDTLPEETEYQRWARQQKTVTEPADSGQRLAQYEAGVAMRTLAEEYGVDYEHPPVELNSTIEDVTSLYNSENPKEAIKAWRTGLKKMQATQEAAAKAKVKQGIEDAERLARLGVKDIGAPTGGVGRRSFTRQEIQAILPSEYLRDQKLQEEIELALIEGRIT